MTNYSTGRQVDYDLTQRLYECFNEDEIVELTGLIAFQNLSRKFNSALDLPAQGFCRLPEVQVTIMKNQMFNNSLIQVGIAEFQGNRLDKEQ